MAKIKSAAELSSMPITEKSADGTTTLRRFDVSAVIYAPKARDARARLEHCIDIDAATVVASISRVHPHQRAIAEHAKLNALIQSTGVASTPDQIGKMSPALYEYLFQQRRSAKQQMRDTQADFERYCADDEQCETELDSTADQRSADEYPTAEDVERRGSAS
jgi:hypothetical protein